MSNLSPNHFPQIKNLNHTLNELDEEGIGYECLFLKPDMLNPSQQFTSSDDCVNCENSEDNPIWVDKNNSIIDGHHSWVKGIENNGVYVIKIDLDFNSASRVLNKIGDIYDYNEKLKLEEIFVDINNEGNTIDDFLTTIEERNKSIQTEDTERNKKTLIGYRKKPISENSVVGNFFTLVPAEGHSKFEIEFENLLDLNDIGINHKDSQNPIDNLAKVWFPHINFNELSEEYNTNPTNLKNKAIAKKAHAMGYDGILHSETLLQGLK